MELERDKRLDATRTLKNSEVDLLKAREDLKEMKGPGIALNQAWLAPKNRLRIRQGAYLRLRTS